MSWQAVALKDFRDAIRSRLMLIVAGLFILFTGGGTAIGTTLGLGGGDAMGLIMFFMLSATSVFVPIIAIGISYRAIAGERASGSLKLLLSLPNSRRDVIIGKFLGRSGVVSVAVLIGFIVGLVAFSFAFNGGFDVGVYFAFMLTTLLLGLVFVSIGVSVSAFTTSTFQSAVGSFGLFLIFEFLWGIFMQLLWYISNGFEFPALEDSPPGWLEFLSTINPSIAYDQATRWLVDVFAQGETAQQPGAEALYLEPWFGVIMLLIWIALPLGIGYWRFDQLDL